MGETSAEKNPEIGVTAKQIGRGSPKPPVTTPVKSLLPINDWTPIGVCSGIVGIESWLKTCGYKVNTGVIWTLDDVYKNFAVCSQVATPPEPHKKCATMMPNFIIDQGILYDLTTQAGQMWLAEEIQKKCGSNEGFYYESKLTPLNKIVEGKCEVIGDPGFRNPNGVVERGGHVVRVCRKNGNLRVIDPNCRGGINSPGGSMVGPLTWRPKNCDSLGDKGNGKGISCESFSFDCPWPPKGKLEYFTPHFASLYCNP